jgi:hypothetical protein
MYIMEGHLRALVMLKYLPSSPQLELDLCQSTLTSTLSLSVHDDQQSPRPKVSVSSAEGIFQRA